MLITIKILQLIYLTTSTLTSVNFINKEEYISSPDFLSVIRDAENNPAISEAMKEFSDLNYDAYFSNKAYPFYSKFEFYAAAEYIQPQARIDHLQNFYWDNNTFNINGLLKNSPSLTWNEEQQQALFFGIPVTGAISFTINFDKNTLSTNFEVDSRDQQGLMNTLNDYFSVDFAPIMQYLNIDISNKIDGITKNNETVIPSRCYDRTCTHRYVLSDFMSPETAQFFHDNLIDNNQLKPSAITINTTPKKVIYDMRLWFEKEDAPLIKQWMHQAYGDANLYQNEYYAHWLSSKNRLSYETERFNIISYAKIMKLPDILNQDIKQNVLNQCFDIPNYLENYKNELIKYEAWNNYVCNILPNQHPLDPDVKERCIRDTATYKKLLTIEPESLISGTLASFMSEEQIKAMAKQCSKH